MKKLNTNARQREVMLNIACSGRSHEATARSFDGVYRGLAASEMKLAGSYVSDLLAGRVHPMYRSKFIAGASECIASARQYREENRRKLRDHLRKDAYIWPPDLFDKE